MFITVFTPGLRDFCLFLLDKGLEIGVRLRIVCVPAALEQIMIKVYQNFQGFLTFLKMVTICESSFNNPLCSFCIF